MTAQLSFPVKGDAALACYYVKANWPKGGVEPILHTTGPSSTLTFEFDGDVIRQLQGLLAIALRGDENMARSARMMRMMLARQLVGKVVPNPGRFSFGTASEAG
jgi:hypothetical protein